MKKETKNRQVREGVWETNSSSTHAYTLQTRSNAEAEYKPIVKGPVCVYNCASTGETWSEKLAMVMGYLYLEDRKGEMYRILHDFSTWCNDMVILDFTKLDEAIAKWKTDTESFFEDFGEGRYGYGNSMSEIHDIMNDVVSTPENFRNFVCSTGWIEVNEYYDG